MKRILILFLVLVSVATFSVASAESVTLMPYMVKMPDAIREGLYTGEVIGDVPNGYGVFVVKNSSGVSWHYIGHWENGDMSGEGGQYWDNGKSMVGTFANNAMVSGAIHKNASFNASVDYSNTVDGCYKAIEYRVDGSVLFDGYIDPKVATYKKGTFYTTDGEVFFSGDLGEGFNLNLMYIK